MYSKVIYFEGIYLQDIKNIKLRYKLTTHSAFPEELLDKTVAFADYLMYYNEKRGNYNRIPSHFIGIDNWPANTNLRCWNCTLPFSAMPWFIPNGTCKQIVGDDEVNAMIVYGNYCSANCAMNYILFTNDRNIVDKDTSKTLLYKLYNIVYGASDKIINPFPSYTLLKQFRGPSGMSSHDYRKHYASHN